MPVKKQILAVMLCVILASPAWGAIGAGTQWDVRTTGSDTNGGAFDPGVGSPGTDESTSAGVAITITLTGTTTGTGSPVFSATTHGPGNFVHIASGSGCTTGWFEILSQAAGTATFDHAMGTAANVCVGTLGGSMATPTATVALMTVSGNTAWIQSGTYTVTAQIALPSAGFGLATIAGYGSTHGDFGTAPLITTSTSGLQSIVLVNSGASWNLTNLSWSNTTGGTRSIGFYQNVASVFTFIDKNTWDGFTTAIHNPYSNASFVTSITRNEIKNCTIGINVVSGFQLEGSYIHGCTTGLQVSTTGNTRASVDHTVISGGTNSIVLNNGSQPTAFFLTNSVLASPSGDAISSGVTALHLFMTSSIIYGAGGFGINATGNSLFMRGPGYNAWGSNTSGNVSSGAVYSTDLTGISNPFVSATNFALAAGATALKASGFPGVFPGGLTTGYIDIGAAQSQAATPAATGFGFAQ